MFQELLLTWSSVSIRSTDVLFAFLAGMPKHLVETYITFHDQLQVYNTIAGGLGDPYFKPCSIPQGCPWSMMIIALLLRPVIAICSLPGKVICRILADDLIIVGYGEAHLEPLIQQVDKAFE